MTDARLQTLIERAFEDRGRINPQTTGDVRDAVEKALELLDSGKARVAEKIAGATGPNSWKVNQWLKKAVLLSFRLNDNRIVEGGPGGATWWDKIPSKFAGWGENRFREAGLRAVPGAIVRRSAFVARDVVLMPSFVNLGAYVDSKTMVDTWVTVGSCAQIGKNVHLSGGVGIGGVLEPLAGRIRPSSRTTASSARARKSSRASSSAKARCISMGVFISRLDQDRRPRDRQGPCRLRAALFGRGVRLAAGQEPARRLARPLALLRGDRQDGRRADARQDRDQRAAEGVRAENLRVTKFNHEGYTKDTCSLCNIRVLCVESSFRISRRMSSVRAGAGPGQARPCRRSADRCRAP